jgi:hypothetical protein
MSTIAMAQWLNPPAHVLPWAEIGPASEILNQALSELFWEGLTREISHAILSYKILDNSDILPEEKGIFQRLPESVFHFIEPWGVTFSTLRSESAADVSTKLHGRLTCLEKSKTCKRPSQYA